MGRIIDVSRVAKAKAVKADHFDNVKYYFNMMLKHEKQLECLRTGFHPFRTFRISKILRVIEEDKQNVELYTRLYCGDDVYRAIGCQLGIRA